MQMMALRGGVVFFLLRIAQFRWRLDLDKAFAILLGRDGLD